MSDAQIKKYITTDRNILGGTPVLTGTRIPLERISELLKQGYSETAFKEEYPHVDTKKIQTVISYLYDLGLNVFEGQKKIQTAS